MAEPEYLYAVVDAFNEFVVDRARVTKRTKKGVWFADRTRAVHYRAALTHDEVKRRLATTPEGAIEKWRKSLRDYIEDREKDLRHVRKQLDGPAPKNGWDKDD